ncbi:GRAM domain-containing protein 1B-like isoform X1 [Carassius auratus]|uniref:GRAM domain-containing protein 1B-like isoform X1 n=1 Tax=Carassius auratus TaxID=7957 RepID=A0A6P6KUD9_CARAU|nr:GRAM domain-containing protein 1B-like isoform X1 [Carassius auratus]
MSETLQLPALQIQGPVDGECNGCEVDSALSSSSSPSLRRKRFKMRRMKNVMSEKEQLEKEQLQRSGSKEYLQLPSIEITPSSDEDAAWSSCSTPSASPQRRRFLLRKWLRGGEKKEHGSESSSQQSSLQSSHEEESTRYLSPNTRDDSTASNSNRSSPACSPVLHKRLRSPTPQSPEGENMVEKSSDHSSDKAPSTPEQAIQRTYSQSLHSTRPAGKNSKSHKRLSKKSQSWYNVLSPTYKQRNEDFRKLFKQLPDTERLIVDYSCALQRDILLQGRLYLSENWLCFYSNIFRWETLLTVRLKDVCSMTKEKTARLIPNAIQLCTDGEKHFFTSFGARDRTYMMMFRLWQNALLEKPLCPKELWHFVHQCYGNELGLTSDDEDYVPPDDDFNTMGYCEEIPTEENETNDNCPKTPDAKMDISPQLHRRVFPNNSLNSTDSTDGPVNFDVPPVEDFSGCVPEDLLPLPLPDNKLPETSGSAHVPTPSPSLDFNDNEDLPTELSDSSETHDEAGEVQAFQEDLNGKLYINEVYKFSVDKLHDILFTDSQFMREFLEQRRFSDVVYHPWKKEDTGNQTREIMYTVSLSNPLAPKTAAVTETQTLHKASQVSECYIIDAEVITHNVPYHDYFYTLNRYMLTRVAKNKCRLRVSAELRYRKQPWGLVKGFIERNFWSGLDEYFRYLELELSKVKLVLSEPHKQSPKSKALRTATMRRRKRQLTHMRQQHLDEVLSPVTTPEEEKSVIHRIKHVAGSTQTRHIPEHRSEGLALYSVSKLLLIISSVICVSLVLLVFLNMMLFYKLWMLEYTAQSLTSWQGFRAHESKLPETQIEWAQLLESQQHFHENELEKWREIIKSSVLLLDEMRESLMKLQKGMGINDYNSDSGESHYH